MATILSHTHLQHVGKLSAKFQSNPQILYLQSGRTNEHIRNAHTHGRTGARQYNLHLPRSGGITIAVLLGHARI